MRSSTPRPRGRYAIAVALALVGVLLPRFVASSNDEPTKAAIPRTAEDTSVAAPPEPAGETPVRPLAPFTVPVRTDPPRGVACTGGWFDNPVLRVGVCVPEGWGFTDFASDARLAEIPSTMLDTVRILSARAFPWSPGTAPFQAVTTRGITDVELNLLEPGAITSTECTPTEPRTVGSLSFLTCEQFYDAQGLAAATGPVRAVKVIVPLLHTPLSIDGSPRMTGARLLVIGRMPATARAEEVKELWALIDSIRPR